MIQQLFDIVSSIDAAGEVGTPPVSIPKRKTSTKAHRAIAEAHIGTEAAPPVLASQAVPGTLEVAFTPSKTPETHVLEADADFGSKASMAELPRFRVPGGCVRNVAAARELGEFLGKTGRYFAREKSLVVVRRDEMNGPILEVVKPAKLITAAEEVCRIFKPAKDADTWEPTVLTKSMAESILNADRFFSTLPPINLVTQCPVLIERGGHLIQVAKYDRESGIYAGGRPAEEVSLENAKSLLLALIHDFHFASPADQSRALAALITPALVSGGLLSKRVPATLVEADQSQAGKGYFVRLFAALYGNVPATVAQAKQGVGGLEESFDNELIKGRQFVCLDNVRGRLDSCKLESFMTEDRYSARVPYSNSIEIDPSKTILLVTSNRAELTKDFANRVSTIRLAKQPPGHRFPSYPEGDLLEHLRASQTWYLGAVFRIVGSWYEARRPSSEVIGHDFRAWAGILDWIVVNLLGQAPLLEGHQEIQRRTVNPWLTWLRDVAHAVEAQGKLNAWLRPNQILDILTRAGGVEIPGVKEEDDIECSPVRNNAFRGIGRRIGECLDGNEAVEVDGFLVQRQTTTDEGCRDRKEFRFATPKSPRSHPEVTPQ